MKIVLLGIAALLMMGGTIYLLGTQLPVEHSAAVRTHLAQPPHTVYEAITDIASAPSWRTGVDSIVPISGTGEPLRWREVSSFGTLEFRAEEHIPGRRLVVRVHDPEQQFGGRWIYELGAGAAGTDVVITEQGEVYNPIFRVLSRYVFGHHRNLERYASDLARRFGEEPDVTRVN